MRTLTLALLIALGSAAAVGCTARPSPGVTAAAESRAAGLQSALKVAEAGRAAAVAAAEASDRQVRDRDAKLTALTAQLAAAGRDRDSLTRQVAALGKDRDALADVLKTRTAEKDQLAGQLDGFRKGLRELLGQADTAAVALGTSRARR